MSILGVLLLLGLMYVVCLVLYIPYILLNKTIGPIKIEKIINISGAIFIIILGIALFIVGCMFFAMSSEAVSLIIVLPMWMGGIALVRTGILVAQSKA